MRKTIIITLSLLLSFVTMAQKKIAIVMKNGDVAINKQELIDSIKIVDDGKNPTIGGHEFVDLGLPSGLKWAKMNIGSTSLSDVGAFISWGETEEKEIYTSKNYLAPGSKTETQLEEMGIIENRVLTKEHDAAYVVWGEKWRMPTENDFRELLKSTTAEWTEEFGIPGFRLTAKNGNFIFFPLNGHKANEFKIDRDYPYGRYWTASWSDGYGESVSTSYEISEEYGFDKTIDNRFNGLCIRPVSKADPDPEE